MNNILILIGPSGGGKTTIAEKLDATLDFVKVVTDTSRNPRTNERDGIDYNFVSRDYFKLHADEYIETNVFRSGHIYGSNAMRINKARANADAVICVEINGAKAIKKYYGDLAHIIYIHRDLDKIYAVLDERLANGDMTSDEVTERKEKILQEIESRNSELVEFEVDNNGSLDDSLLQVKQFVENGYR